MKRCFWVRRYFAEALYGELSASRSRAMERHLRTCDSCRQKFEALQSTLRLMDLRSQEPPESFWVGYWDRLQEKWRTSDRSPASGRERIFPVHVPWRQIGFAVAFVILGVTIGKLTSTRDRTGGIPQDISMLSLDERTKQYLDRSKILILGLVNYEPGPDETETFDITREKRMSADLVLEAGVLKDAWSSPGDRRLYELIADLELILIQIANLESEYDLHGIEMVRSGVDRRSILLKMTLEEMRRSAESRTVSRKSIQKSS